jgi:hypothetical protein
MRLVMFDAMKLRSDSRRAGVHRLRQRFGDAGKFRQDFGAFACKRRHEQSIKKFSKKPRVGIARHRDVVNLFECDARFLQAIANRGGGKSRGIFYAIETLFLDGGNQPAIADQRRGSVSVIRIDAQNIHGVMVQSTLGVRVTPPGAAGTIRSKHKATTGVTTRSVRPKRNSTRRARRPF